MSDEWWYEEEWEEYEWSDDGGDDEPAGSGLGCALLTVSLAGGAAVLAAMQAAGGVA